MPQPQGINTGEYNPNTPGGPPPFPGKKKSPVDMRKNYSDEQHRGIQKNRMDRDAAASFGYSLEDQGYRNAKDMGKAAFERQKMRAQFGRWGDDTWMQKIGPNGEVMWKARAQNTDRVKKTGGQWFTAPDYVQRGYGKSKSYFDQHPDADYTDYEMWNGLQKGVRSGKIKAGGDGKYYYASGQAFDANGRRINDDVYTNPALAQSLFGGYTAPKVNAGTSVGSVGEAWDKQFNTAGQQDASKPASNPYTADAGNLSSYQNNTAAPGTIAGTTTNSQRYNPLKKPLDSDRQSIFGAY